MTPVELNDKINAKSDLVLLDIKHTNNDIHINHIGVGNKIILENAALKRYARCEKGPWAHC